MSLKRSLQTDRQTGGCAFNEGYCVTVNVYPSLSSDVLGSIITIHPISIY